MKETLRVLVVDDSEKDLQRMRIALTEASQLRQLTLLPYQVAFDVDTETSYVGAINRLNQAQEERKAYNIAIVDLLLKKSEEDLPHLDADPRGLQVLRFIIEHSPLTRVLVVTADPSPNSVATAFEAITQGGAFHYLFKGVSLERQLLLEVRRAVESIMIERELQAMFPLRPLLARFVVKIVDSVDNSVSTAFFVNEKGFLLTCWHVVEPDFAGNVREWMWVEYRGEQPLGFAIPLNDAPLSMRVMEMSNEDLTAKQ